ncbi:receptor L domain protein, partial [Ostertagia ostertagi]
SVNDNIGFDCSYHEEYLTASTKSPWASHCAVITGLIRIGSRSHLTEQQLEKLFENITTVKGGILVEGTNLRRLSFLKNVVKIVTYHTTYVLEITDNAFLTQLNLDKFNSSDGIVRIQRNPLLNMSSLCNRLDKILDGNWQVSRNKVNCGGYHLDFPLTFTSILNVPPNLNCYSRRRIPPERLAVLSSVKKIAGCLIIQRTNLETLSFLGNLEEISCRIFTSITYLNYLGLSKLTKISTIVPIEAMGNRILEITYDEIEVLVSTDVPTIQFSGIFPTDDLPWDICVFNSLTDDLIMLSLNCTSLIGLLYYENRSFSRLEVEILGRMRNIYGNVELVNVNITDLSIFSALERIISLN